VAIGFVPGKRCLDVGLCLAGTGVNWQFVAIVLPPGNKGWMMAFDLQIVYRIMPQKRLLDAFFFCIIRETFNAGQHGEQKSRRGMTFGYWITSGNWRWDYAIVRKIGTRIY
jgi:hypothetical protein